MIEVVARHGTAYGLRVCIVKCLQIAFKISSHLSTCNAVDIAKRDSSLSDGNCTDDTCIYNELSCLLNLGVSKDYAMNEATASGCCSRNSVLTTVTPVTRRESETSLHASSSENAISMPSI